MNACRTRRWQQQCTMQQHGDDDDDDVDEVKKKIQLQHQNKNKNGTQRAKERLKWVKHVELTCYFKCKFMDLFLVLLQMQVFLLILIVTLTLLLLLLLMLTLFSWSRCLFSFTYFVFSIRIICRINIELFIGELISNDIYNFAKLINANKWKFLASKFQSTGLRARIRNNFRECEKLNAHLNGRNRWMTKFVFLRQQTDRYRNVNGAHTLELKYANSS